MRVTHNDLATNKPVALGFPVEFEFRSVAFFWRQENMKNHCCAPIFTFTYFFILLTLRP